MQGLRRVRLRPLAAARSASTFSYLRLGRAPAQAHALTFDESERGEVWHSATIPRVHPDPALVAAASAAAAEGEHAQVQALRRAHPEVWLVHLFCARLREGAGGAPLPLAAEDLQRALAPPSAAERAALATERGRQEAMVASRADAERVVALLGALQQDALDGGLGGGGALPPAARAGAVLAMAGASGALAAALASLRAVALIHAARLAALPEGEERGAAEAAWLESLGLPAGAAPRAFRSPRVPADLYETWDAPLASPRSASEAAAEGSSASARVLRQLGMEHRDRAEFMSRARLPVPLHAGAPTPALEAAALALEANPSLSPLDRQRMLAAYMDGLDMAPSATDFSLEKSAVLDPQPQWGWYDPAVTRMQDDAQDAMAGRGKFSAYRGSTWEDERTPPARSGLPQPLNEAAGTPHTPLEALEEAEAAFADTARRALAESAAASAAITAALERSMGLRPRGGSAAAAAAQATFFERFADGQRPAPELVAPVKGPRFEVERKELQMGVGVKVKKVDGKKKGK